MTCAWNARLTSTRGTKAFLTWLQAQLMAAKYYFRLVLDALV